MTITALTAGYAGNFTVSLAPTDVFFQVLEVVTIAQTATGSGPGYVNAVTIAAGSSGYAPQTPITFSGGGGSGAFAVANTTTGTAATTYQPAYPAAPGYDLTTGLGSPNANSLVNTCNWYGLPNGTYGMYSPANSSTLTSNAQTFNWCVSSGLDGLLGGYRFHAGRKQLLFVGQPGPGVLHIYKQPADEREHCLRHSVRVHQWILVAE